ncbi:anti-sigma factor family protein [Paenibacillus albus]|nr:zf-HC2 domain-containing protein [Paenibacillus albus]
MSNHPEEQLSAYLDDELGDEDRQLVEKHLESCETCRAIMEDLFTMKQQFGEVFALVDAPENLENRVLHALRQEQSQKKHLRDWAAAIVIGLIPLIVLYFIAGPVALKLIHGCYKLMVTLLYAASHFILSVPTLSVTTILLAVIILATSSYSLKRLLQTNAG